MRIQCLLCLLIVGLGASGCVEKGKYDADNWALSSLRASQPEDRDRAPSPPPARALSL